MISAGASFDLGTAFNIAFDPAVNGSVTEADLLADLEFSFIQVGDTFGFDGGVELVGSSAAVTGDYNGNGIVDDADYSVWLAALGGTTLLNDNTPGTVDDTDYDYWKANFGSTSGIGTVVGASIPEPSTLILALVSSGLVACRRKRN